MLMISMKWCIAIDSVMHTNTNTTKPTSHRHPSIFNPMRPFLKRRTVWSLLENISQPIWFNVNTVRQIWDLRVENLRSMIGQITSSVDILDPKTNLVSLNKCSLLPYSTDFLSSCFRHCEPGRYIVKVPKSNEGVFLLWVLPNQIMSGRIDLLSTNPSTELQFHRKRKILLGSVTSPDHPMLAEWKRDFSVVTLLVNRVCLEHLASVFPRGDPSISQQLQSGRNISTTDDLSLRRIKQRSEAMISKFSLHLSNRRCQTECGHQRLILCL